MGVWSSSEQIDPREHAVPVSKGEAQTSLKYPEKDFFMSHKLLVIILTFNHIFVSIFTFYLILDFLL